MLVLLLIGARSWYQTTKWGCCYDVQHLFGRDATYLVMVKKKLALSLRNIAARTFQSPPRDPPRVSAKNLHAASRVPVRKQN